MRQALRHYMEDLRAYLNANAWAKRIAFFSLLLIALMIALPLWRLIPIVRENSYIPLHYNIYLGIDRFGPWYNIFILPVLGLVVLLLNLSLAARFSEVAKSAFRPSEAEPVLSRLALWLTPVLQIILFAGIIFTLLLNL